MERKDLWNGRKENVMKTNELNEAAIAAITISPDGEIVGGYENAWKSFADLYNVSDDRARQAVARAARRLRHGVSGRSANGSPPGGNPGSGRKSVVGKNPIRCVVLVSKEQHKFLRMQGGSPGSVIRRLIDAEMANK